MSSAAIRLFRYSQSEHPYLSKLATQKYIELTLQEMDNEGEVAFRDGDQ